MSIGGARAQYHLRQPLVFLDAVVLNRPEVMIGQMPAKVDVAEGSVTDDATADIIRGQLTALADLARRSR